MSIEVCVIDYVEHFVLTSDERRLPIVDLFDRSGLRTEDPRSAVICVAGRAGGWLSLKLSAFDPRALQ